MSKRLSERLRSPFARNTVTPAKFGMTRQKSENHPLWLALAAAIIIVLPKLPFGNYIIYPFMILTTWFHEMGHGLTAILLGHEFKELVIFASGSGYALTLSPPDTFALSQALISMGGPLGPAIFGSALILASQTDRARRLALYTLGFVIILSTAIWVRSLVGWLVLLPMGAAILFTAQKATPEISRFAVQFLGVNAAISMFGQWRYLFSVGGTIGGSHQKSDTAAIAEQLHLPHWFWASGLILIGLLMIGASLYRVLRKRDVRWTVH